MRAYSKSLITILMLGATSYASALPPLAATRLFSKQVWDCHQVDMGKWRHPVRTVLLEDRVKIERVDLCNGGKYPIFFVRFPYDPQGDTKSYFGPLLDKMRVANGGWPYAFVALSDNTTMIVSYRDGRHAEVDFERFQPEFAEQGAPRDASKAARP